MAFDRPIEADRIDDFNLISAFVRAPLWILSGFLGIKTTNDDDDIVRLPRLDDDLHSNSCSSSSSSNHHHHEHHHCSSPRGVVTSLSASTTTTTRSLQLGETAPWDAAVFHQRTSDDPVDEASSSTTCTDGLNRSKNLSWSDQSGQRLCEYANEVRKKERKKRVRLGLFYILLFCAPFSMDLTP